MFLDYSWKKNAARWKTVYKWRCRLVRVKKKQTKKKCGTARLKLRLYKRSYLSSGDTCMPGYLFIYDLHAWLLVYIWLACLVTCLYMTCMPGYLFIYDLHAWLLVYIWLACLVTCLYMTCMPGYLFIYDLHAWLLVYIWLACLVACLYMTCMPGYLFIYDLHAWLLVYIWFHQPLLRRHRWMITNMVRVDQYWSSQNSKNFHKSQTLPVEDYIPHIETT